MPKVSNTTKAKQTAGAKELSRRSDNVVMAIGNPLLALRDVGKHMKNSPLTGWTIQECVTSLTERTRIGAALMPIPADAKAAKLVRALMRDGQEALDATDEAAYLIGPDFDAGMKRGDGASIFGFAVESFANKAGAAFESAAALMGANAAMFCFYDPAEKAREAA